MLLLLILCIAITEINTLRVGKSGMWMKSSDAVEYGKYLSKDKPIFVAGGSSGVGYELVKKLSALEVPTKVLVRWPDAQAMLNTLPHVTAVLGDALDEAAVQSCMLVRM
jgi:hypothetical protein